jgi:protocatechuate 3,4-dioxygenase beta subunit
MGPAGDTASYSKVAGVVVTIRVPDDSASHTRGQLVAAATSDANGRYSLGSIKPGAYVLEAVPPSASPYKPTTWGFLITDYMPDRIELGVVLYRR